MKQLVCEMCGGTNIIKQDGVYVCQSCGTKYSVEDARSMMVEGNVDVSGSTVKVDNTEELANLYQLARRAKDDNNSENATRYYDMILIKDPNSWEASFYQVFFKAQGCKIAEIASAANSIENCLKNVFILVRDCVKSKAEQVSAVKEIVMRSQSISQMLYSAAKNHYDEIPTTIRHNYSQEALNNEVSAITILLTCGDEIKDTFGNDEMMLNQAINAWKKGIDMLKQLLPNVTNKSAISKVIDEYYEKIKKSAPDTYQNIRNTESEARLRSEISSLEKKLMNERNTSTTSSAEITLGVFFLIAGIMMLFFAMSTYDVETLAMGGICVAIAAFILFMCCGKKNRENAESSKLKRIEKLEAQIKEKEEEIRNLYL